MNPKRDRFSDASAAPIEAAHARQLLKLLLAQDGSTTRVCETIAAGPIEVLVHHQRRASQVPAAVKQTMAGAAFIERCTSLVAHGQVMMDNLVYVAIDSLDEELRIGLENGAEPVGHLLDRMWVRRAPLDAEPAELYEQLWRTVGTPDPAAARAYRIEAPAGTLMVIAETFRRGMLMDRAKFEEKNPAVTRIA